MAGYAIILNGPSSAGKSTLARAIQAKASEQSDYVLHFTMDAFLEMIPKGVAITPKNFPNMVTAIADCAAVLLDSDHNLVIDTVFKPEALNRLRGRLQEFNAVAVGVDAPLAVREEREKTRGDREIGLTASQEGTIHGNTRYDLKLDTSKITPEGAADQVIAVSQASRSVSGPGLALSPHP
ncbi:MAG TPA: AAA family ATPase [Micavibrio sp.]|jgi:chloramphenicol 3-O phosphotransferase